MDATQALLSFTPDTTTGWTGGASYTFTLIVIRGSRTASYSILLFVSSDRYMPRATVTDFDENLKYNPTAGTLPAFPNETAGTFFSGVFTDHVVLQREPAKAAVYGVIFGVSSQAICRCLRFVDLL